MIEVARFDPAVNDGEIQVFRTVRRPARWRITIRATPEGGEPIEINVRLVDRMRLSEAHAEAVREISAILPDGMLCERASMQFFAELP